MRNVEFGMKIRTVQAQLHHLVKAQRQISNIHHPTSNIPHLTSNISHQTSHIKHLESRARRSRYVPHLTSHISHLSSGIASETLALRPLQQKRTAGFGMMPAARSVRRDRYVKRSAVRRRAGEAITCWRRVRAVRGAPRSVRSRPKRNSSTAHSRCSRR